MANYSDSRRELIKKAIYVTPAVVTLSAVPAFAKLGSGTEKCNNGVGNGADCQPPGLPPINDGASSQPGNPGNKK